jgi:DNA-binding beta-propeller fold protein YncE
VPAYSSDRWVRIVTLGAAVLLAIALATVIVFPFFRSSSPTFPGNSIGAINADGSLGASVWVGQSPDGVAYSPGALWAANRSDNTVTRIDPTTRATQAIAVGASPTALTVTRDTVQITLAEEWIAEYPAANQLYDKVFACKTPLGAVGWYCNPQV